MKRHYMRLRWKLYRNLSKKLTHLIPEEYRAQASVDILESIEKGEDDMLIITFKLPHSLTRKLMWSLKVWKEN